MDIFPGGADRAVRIEFFGDEVDRILSIEPASGATIEELGEVDIYPAGNFVTTK